MVFLQLNNLLSDRTLTVVVQHPLHRVAGAEALPRLLELAVFALAGDAWDCG